MSKGIFAKLVEPVTQWRESTTKVGFIDPLVHLALAVLTIFSPHHWLQSAEDKLFNRYTATDLYFSVWAIFAGLALWCAHGRWCVPGGAVVTVFVVWRLVEALSREMWVILYRGIPLTSAARVVVVALVNYATITGLFGFLYGQGESGFAKAAWISLSFSPPDAASAGFMEIVQSGYCLLFIVIIFAAFVARVHFIEKADSNDGGGGITGGGGSRSGAGGSVAGGERAPAAESAPAAAKPSSAQ